MTSGTLVGRRTEPRAVGARAVGAWAAGARAVGARAAGARAVGVLVAGGLAGCAPAAVVPVAGPVAGPAASVTPAVPELCASLCALAPSAATPLAPAFRTRLEWTADDGAGQPDDVLVMLFWKEPSGEGIEALSGFNDLAHVLGGLSGVRLALVHVGGDVAQARQARRELIDRDVKVSLLAGEGAQALVAALAPDRLPATYVLDRQRRPQARFDGVARWRSSAVRPYFEGLLAGGACGLSFEGSGAEGRCPAAGP